MTSIGSVRSDYGWAFLVGFICKFLTSFLLNRDHVIHVTVIHIFSYVKLAHKFHYTENAYILSKSKRRQERINCI